MNYTSTEESNVCSGYQHYIYAHNTAAPLYEKAKSFIEKIIAEEDENQNPIVGIPLQVCSEFVNVYTRQSIGKPLSVQNAVQVIRKYSDYLEIPIIHSKSSQLDTFLRLLENTTTRKKVFDIYLAATLKDNNIDGLYTVNVNDFQEFDFIRVENPL